MKQDNFTRDNFTQDNSKRDNYNYLFKISLLGEGGVGKTTLIRRYIDGIFIEDTKMTIGVDFYSKIVKIEDNNGINACKFIIWDLGGHSKTIYMERWGRCFCLICPELLHCL